MDRLTHLDIAVQHTAGSNLKSANFLSRKLAGATPEENYDEEYVINILTEQAELNLKYGPIFADQSKRTENRTKLRNDNTETQNEHQRANHKRIEYSRTKIT